MSKDKTCKELVKEKYNNRMEAIRTITKHHTQTLSNYGLSFDYVPPKTFEDQKQGYWRWQLSWGGPSDEFRMYGRKPIVEYWYMDWFDGAKVTLVGKDRELIYRVMMELQGTI